LSESAGNFIYYVLAQYLWPTLAIVITFGIAVLLHEFGHFIAARLSGVGVEIFSIGFGRRLWGFRHNGTDYRISVFPIGGYVKMRGIFSRETERYLQGEDERETAPSASAAEASQEDTAATGTREALGKPLSETTGLRLAQEAIEDADALRRKPWLLRVLVFAAGCGFNFLVAASALALIAWIGSMEDTPLPSRVGPVKEGTAVYQDGLRRGDRIVRFAGLRVTKWQRESSDVPAGVLDILDWLLVAKSREPIECIVVRRGQGGETTHTVVLPPPKETAAAYAGGDFQPLIAPACIGAVTPFSPAHKAGLKVRDVVVAIDDRPIESYDQMREIVSASPGKPLWFRIRRDDQESSMIITPTDRGTKPPTGAIGVIAGSVDQVWFQKGFFESWALGFRQAARLTREVSLSTLRLFARFQYGEMKKSLAGPVGIFGMIYASAREGWKSFLEMMALLNVALLVFNVLPIPILDGGHILITTIESVTRRPVPPRLLAGIYYVFFALIVALLLMATWFDVLRFANWFSPAR
jgi:regulator of sigma E protease